jgi:PAS domain S-box-containing protein
MLCGDRGAGENNGKMMETANSSESPRPEAAESPEAMPGRGGPESRPANDLLERRVADLSESLATARAVLQSTADGILVSDENGMVSDFNANYLDLWKVPATNLRGTPTSHLWALMSSTAANPRQFSARLADIVAGTDDSFDILELADRRILESYSKVLLIGGRNQGRVFSFRDVTERHLSEMASRQLAGIVASSEDAIIGKDLGSIITSWNAGAERIFGYRAAEMIGTSIMRLIPANRRQEEVTILSRIRSGERLDHFETVRLAKDGRELNVSITVSPIKDSAGHVVGASKVARDITEKKRVEQSLKEANEKSEIANRARLQLLESERAARAEAERANRIKDEFLATLSHELRTPLNAVLGWSNLLQIESPKPEDLKQGLEAIERNARVQAQIIEDLLDMSRIMSGKVRLDVQRADLHAILCESVRTVRAAADAKDIHFTCVMDPLKEKFSGDPERLQQVFWNLLNNAVKFTPKNGRVAVFLKRGVSDVEVRISDTGQGISPEFLPFIFNRFQQADATTTRRHGGLGLGLAIVKQLVELHGGEIHVASEGVGKGAAFTVRFPLSAAYRADDGGSQVSAVTTRESLPLPNISLAGSRILVVDDEVDARELVKKVLELAGASVSSADSVSAALNHILTARPDVLVCDIAMPEEDGYALIRQLRDLERDQKDIVPAVALTAYAGSEDRTKAIRSGFQDHLAKPVEPAELLAVVSNLAGRREPAASPE